MDQRIIRLHVDYIRRQGASVRTMKERAGVLRRLAASGPVDLLELTAPLLDKWQSELSVCLSSVATYSSHVRSFYLWCVDVGHLEIDPAARLARPKIRLRRPRPIPAGDFELVLKCAPEPIATWIVLGAFMGLRASEIAGMKREDVTEAPIAGRTRMFVRGVGKGNREFNQPVPQAVVPVLRRHLGGRPGPLWLGASGRPLSSVSISNQTSAFFRGLNMPYTLHWTRHTFATNLQREHGDLLLVKIMLRHQSMNTTLLYVEPAEGLGIDAIDRLAENGLRNKNPNVA